MSLLSCLRRPFVSHSCLFSFILVVPCLACFPLSPSSAHLPTHPESVLYSLLLPLFPLFIPGVTPPPVEKFYV